MSSEFMTHLFVCTACLPVCPLLELRAHSSTPPHVLVCLHSLSEDRGQAWHELRVLR